jgi:Tol biopolymer transport system component
MTRALRMTLVLLLATSILVVVPGELDATVPGAIGRITFTSDSFDLNGDIFVRDFAGSTPIRLTNHVGADYLARWSPDGTRIAFARQSAGTDVWVMDPAGANAINLTNGVGLYNAPFDWSPDGKRILFVSSRSGNLDVWAMSADGSNQQQLTNTPEDEAEASWSPDGTTIAVERDAGLGTDIWLMDADGSNLRNATNREGTDGAPSWSPDGTKIVYASSFGPGTNIWVMDADSSNQKNLTNTTSGFNWDPAWSPDGNIIAFTSDRDGDYDIWMMSADGAGQAHLTDRPGHELTVAWESINRDPVAMPDQAEVRRGRSVDVLPLKNDADPDGSVLELIDITRLPNEGSVVINPDGSVTYTHNGMMPPAGHGYSYLDTFEYEVQDPRLATARAEVSIALYPSFDDVPEGNIFVDDIEWLAMREITRGCNPPDNTLFCPDSFVTRAQMAAFLVRARGYFDDGGGNLFVDDDGSTFEADIDKLGTAGVTRGCNPPINDRFCPGRLVTRAQMAAFLVRAYNLADIGLHNLFVDDEGSVFEADIDKLGAHGVSRGCNPPANDRFCPNQHVTREQMAAFIRRAAGTSSD